MAPSTFFLPFSIYVEPNQWVFDNISHIIWIFNVSFQVFIFCGELLLSLNWAVMADILLVSFHTQIRHISAETLHQSVIYLLLSPPVCCCTNQKSYSWSSADFFCSSLWRCREPLPDRSGEKHYNIFTSHIWKTAWILSPMLLSLFSARSLML